MPTPVYQIRVSPEQRAAWNQAASEAGYESPAAWVRAVCDLAAARRDNPRELATQIAGLRGELVRVGSNLNQIARAANTAARRGEDVQPDPRQIDLEEAIAEAVRRAGELLR